jgi:cytochrome d ubiquinol oxidase subunit II
MWGAVVLLYLAVTLSTFLLRGELGGIHFFATAMIALSLAALLAILMARARNRDVATFLASAAFLATLLVAAAGTIFPYLVPAYPGGRNGISIYSASSSGLTTAFVFTIVALVATIAYSAVVWRRVGRKVRV